jgi:hypothetical protein
MRSDRAAVGEKDLPIPSGKASPTLHDVKAPASVAVRDPDRLARFTERLLEATAPDQFALYSSGLAQLRTFVGVDLHRDVLGKMTNLSVAFGPGAAITFEGKLAPRSAASVSRALTRAGPYIQEALSQMLLGRSDRRATRLGRTAVRDGIVVGSIGLSGLPRPVRGKRLPGASGALSARSSPGRAGQVLRLLPGIPAQLGAVLAGLGDVRLAVRAETRELTARGLVRARGRLGSR